MYSKFFSKAAGYAASSCAIGTATYFSAKEDIRRMEQAKAENPGCKIEREFQSIGGMGGYYKYKAIPIKDDEPTTAKLEM
ncbi:MAG: hypothetical protein H0U57_05030 [Tatlockia sp.]|nr:hypothetical protein [Tatlockia sp.]